MESGQIVACGILTTIAMFYGVYYGHTTLFNMLSCVMCCIALYSLHRQEPAPPPPKEE